MASQGPNYPSTMTEQAGAGTSWIMITNAQGAPNDAGATLAADGISKILRTGPAGLGFTIPAGATVNGIKVTIRSRGGGVD